MNAAPDQLNSGPEVLEVDESEALVTLAGHAIALASNFNRRVLLGIAGGPGSGKSTLARQLVQLLTETVPNSALVVPMDGFHRPHAELVAAGMAEAKGAPHTFDAAGFVAALTRLKSADGTVGLPTYSREIEDVVADAITVPGNVPILVIEGNYLLLDTPEWRPVGGLLDYKVFLEVARDKVRARLIKRHAEHGLFTEERNRKHIETVDLVNFDLVRQSRGRADLVLRLQTGA